MRIDKFYTTKQIMGYFGVTRDRVSKIAHSRNWRFSWIGRNKIYNKEDVENEIRRRIKKGLKVKHEQ